MQKERKQKSAVQMYVETIVEMTANSKGYLVIEKTEDGYTHSGVGDYDIEFEEEYRLMDSASMAALLENSKSLERMYIDAKEEDDEYIVRTEKEYGNI